MKKAIVIYNTRFGNTEKIAKSLAQGMKEQGVTVDCLKVEDVDTNKLTEYDLVAVGGPTHMLGASEPMKRFLKKLEQVNLKGKKAFAFDTKMEYRFSGSAAKRIEKRLKKLGMNIVRPRSSAIVIGREGPLEDGMDEMFKQIAVEIAKTI
jgi:flavorubredoxin